MRRLSTYNLGAEREEEKDKGGKGAGISSSGSSLLGDNYGRKRVEDDASGNGYSRYQNGELNGNDEDVEANPWVSVSSVSTATLRSRHYGQNSSRGFGFARDVDEDSLSYSSENQERRPEQEARRRRRSRSAFASISKHPLCVDEDDSGDLEERGGRHHHSHPGPPHREQSSMSDHQSRPCLRRAIASLDERTGGSTDETFEWNKGATARDVDVIVHKVLRTDTLAGIALKYNIPLARLRKANKLWTNDSIHIRSVLYIPLRDILSPRSLISNFAFPSSGHDKTPSEFESNPDTNTETSRLHTQLHTQPATHTQSEIQKVPLTQLLFFPPSGASNTPASISISRSISNYDTQRTLPSTATNSNSSPAFSFTSLLHGLSTATQEIKSRLSFDSYSSSDLGDGEIEMDNVKKYRSGAVYNSEGNGEGDDNVAYTSAPTPTPNILQTSSRGTQHPHRRIGESSSMLAVSSPFSPPTTPQKAIVRSMQLQPSPEMKIPTRTPRDERRRKEGTSPHTTGFRETNSDAQ